MTLEVQSLFLYSSTFWHEWTIRANL